ncbi:MAG: GFA family protein [Cephaloticoccus sp.]|nr:GFA family protein [Cephaloticoccus sp.]
MLTGGCLCGRVRYELKRAPRNILDCHCIDCRRSSGAPYISWGTIDRDNFSLSRGKLKQVRFAGRIRSFAPCCGTQILFQVTKASPTCDLALASLDRPPAFKPRKALWCEDHLPWVPLAKTIPAYLQRTKSEQLRAK